MSERLRCPDCGSEVDSATRNCAKCKVYIRSELELLRIIETTLKPIADIDASLKTIKNIAVWWLILSIIGAAIFVLYVLTQIH